MTAPTYETTTEDEGQVYCPVHPTAEANIRCNRCGRPMCTKCAVLTPVGYRCKDCVKQQQDKFFNAQVLDYIVAAGVSFFISLMAAALLSRFGFFFIAIIISPAVGGLIGRAVLRMTGKRRGRYTAIVVGTCVFLGGLPFFLVNPLSIGIYLFLATSTAAGQFALRL